MLKKFEVITVEVLSPTDNNHCINYRNLPTKKIAYNRCLHISGRKQLVIKFFRINTVRGDVLPVVVVEMWEGRTEEQKAKLIKGITEVFKEIGVEPEHLSIVIHDVPRSNWGMRGEQASKLIKKGAE